MTLAFSTQLDGKPTHFVEKIWEGLLTAKLELCLWDISNYVFQLPRQELGKYVLGSMKPKVHAIHKDSFADWEKGQDIRMVVNIGSPTWFQFAPVIKCLSTQRIEIFRTGSGPIMSHLVKIDGKIRYDGLYLAFHDTHKGDQVEEFLKQKRFIEKLALNDGFDSVEAFFEYFDQDYTGKIIHWTDLKY